TFVLTVILRQEETHLGLIAQHNALLAADRSRLSPAAVEALEQLGRLEAADYEWAAELAGREIVRLYAGYADAEKLRAASRRFDRAGFLLHADTGRVSWAPARLRPGRAAPRVRRAGRGGPLPLRAGARGAAFRRGVLARARNRARPHRVGHHCRRGRTRRLQLCVAIARARVAARVPRRGVAGGPRPLASLASRGGRRDRPLPHRARGRLRHGRHADARRTPRRRLGAEWREELRQLSQRRRVLRLRPHRSGFARLARALGVPRAARHDRPRLRTLRGHGLPRRPARHRAPYRGRGAGVGNGRSAGRRLPHDPALLRREPRLHRLEVRRRRKADARRDDRARDRPGPVRRAAGDLPGRWFPDRGSRDPSRARALAMLPRSLDAPAGYPLRDGSRHGEVVGAEGGSRRHPSVPAAARPPGLLASAAHRAAP